MKTPREWVEPMYDGADYQPWRIIGCEASVLEDLIKEVQREAWFAGEVACMDRLNDMASKMVKDFYQSQNK